MVITATNRHPNVVPTVVVNSYCNLSSTTLLFIFDYFTALGTTRQVVSFSAGAAAACCASAVRHSEAQGHCEIERWAEGKKSRWSGGQKGKWSKISFVLGRIVLLPWYKSEIPGCAWLDGQVIRAHWKGVEFLDHNRRYWSYQRITPGILTYIFFF